MTIDKHYEVFLETGSAVSVRDTLDEALSYAKWLSMHNIDCDVVVTEVTETMIKKFRNGGEVG